MLHVALDVGQLESGVELSKIHVVEVLEDEAGSFEVAALDDIEHFDDVGVVEGLQEMVLSFDFNGLDG